ncbi:MAG: glycosyltransferase family 61 protein [Flavobacteriales bacterium]|nr:glycosyltransferase family 61 protein [Flavobacteriales bacterium]
MKHERTIDCQPLVIRNNKHSIEAPSTTYTVLERRQRVIRNVFVTHEGLCLKNMLLVKNSHFNLTGKLDKVFYVPLWRLATEQYLVSKYGKSLTVTMLDEGTYLLVHTKWFGYFFWLTDVIPKLILTMSSHSSVRLIYPVSWDQIPYVQDTLKLFPNLEHEQIPSGVHMQIKQLLLPDTRKWSNAIDPQEIKLIRSFFFDKLNSYKTESTISNDKIFISRKKAKRRRIINENEVERALQELDFKCITMEELSLFEQIEIMRNAKFVIGVHGAGLANCIFMQKRGRLIEISPEIEDTQNLRIPFWRIANAVKVKHQLLVCQDEESSVESNYDSNLLVDIFALKDLIENG